MLPQKQIKTINKVKKISIHCLLYKEVNNLRKNKMNFHNPCAILISPKRDKHRLYLLPDSRGCPIHELYLSMFGRDYKRANLLLFTFCSIFLNRIRSTSICLQTFISKKVNTSPSTHSSPGLFHSEPELSGFPSSSV